MSKALSVSLKQEWGTVIIWLTQAAHLESIGAVSDEIEKLFCDPIVRGKEKEKDFFQTLQEINQSQEKSTALNKKNIKNIIFDLTDIEYIRSGGISAFLKAHRFLSPKPKSQSEDDIDDNIGPKVILLNPHPKVKKTLTISQLIDPEDTIGSLFAIREGRQADVLANLQSNPK